MRISDWSSDVCSSDLGDRLDERGRQAHQLALDARLDDAADELEELRRAQDGVGNAGGLDKLLLGHLRPDVAALEQPGGPDDREGDVMADAGGGLRSEAPTSELPSLMRSSYAVFCL